MLSSWKSGRGERIRTSGLYVPNVALYQAKLHPEEADQRGPACARRTFAVSQKVDDAIAAATLADVNAALRKYLKPDQLVIGFGGDFKP